VSNLHKSLLFFCCNSSAYFVLHMTYSHSFIILTKFWIHGMCNMHVCVSMNVCICICMYICMYAWNLWSTDYTNTQYCRFVLLII